MNKLLPYSASLRQALDGSSGFSGSEFITFTAFVYCKA
jgi:hypothetical protein